MPPRCYNLPELHQAASDGDADRVRQLLTNGADIDQLVSGKRTTALFEAAFKGHVKVVQLLLESGADLAAGEDNPIVAAAQRGHRQVLHTLLKAAAELDREVCRELVNGTGWYGKTALWRAATSEDGTEAVQLLLDAGATIDVVDGEGNTCLHAAVKHDKVAVIQVLLDGGASLDAADRAGMLPLHAAASCGNTDAVNVLLAAGAPVSAIDKEGRTPLHVAAMGDTDDQQSGYFYSQPAPTTAGHVAVLQQLLDAGASHAAVDAEGRTSLHVAAARGQLAVVEQLLAAGADVHAVDSSGCSALQCAADSPQFDASRQHKAVVRHLLRAGARLNTATGHTPANALAAAVSNGDIGTARVLLLMSDFEHPELRAALEVWARSSRPRCTTTLRRLLQEAQAAEGAADKAAAGASSRDTAAAAQQQQQDGDGAQQPAGAEPQQPQQPLLHQYPATERQQQLLQDQQDGDARPQQPQQQPGGLEMQPRAAAAAGAGEDRGYDAAAIMRLIKQEPLPVAAAEADNTSQPHLPGPAALALLREATAAGFPLPAQQQMQYFLLADQAFDAGELLQLYGTYLACSFTTQKAVGRANRSGAIRRALVGNKVQQSRMEQHRPQLAPGLLLLRDAVPQLAGGPLQLLPPEQQQQQQETTAGPRSSKKQKVSDPAEAAAAYAAAAAAAGLAETPATARLLLALRSYEQWLVKCGSEQELPALLQLLLFGRPQQPSAGVIELVDLVAAEEDELQQHQLEGNFEDLLITKEVVPREQQRRAGGGMGAGVEAGGRVKAEPGV